MLSLKSGTKIAIINSDKNDAIYIKDDNGEENEPEIETTDEHQSRMFDNYLKMDKKLSSVDIQLLKEAYSGVNINNTIQLPQKLQRKFEDARKYVNQSLKKHLDYSSTKNILLMPIIQDESYRLYVTGLSGSGKSYFISQFLKYNKPKTKGAGIFLFSPIENDKSLSSIKNLIHLNLDEIERSKEMKGEEFTIEHIPEGSVVLFDDIESHHKNVRKKYMDLRDVLLERGRHRKLSTITVSHNARNGHTTKVSIRESQYWCLFPSANKFDVRMLLKSYGGLEPENVNMLMSQKTRWLFFKKSIPQYAVTEHSVIVI